MSQFGASAAAKNPPWVRQGQGMGMAGQMSQTGGMQPTMMAPMGNTAAAAMLQYPQAQMFQQTQLGQLQQTGMTMQTMGAMGTNQMATAGGLSASIQPTGATAMQQPQLYQQAGTVSYPTRTILASPFAAGTVSSQTAAAPNSGGSVANNTGATPRQRVFTGTVTKVQDNFGFVDEEVFFQTSCCVKGSNPQVGDKVLVEAMYNASMPFKWNATRIQVLPMDRSQDGGGGGGGGGNMHVGRRTFTSGPVGYNNVPPPSDDMGGSPINDFGRRNRGNKRNNRRNDDDDFAERKRRRDDQRNADRAAERAARDEKEKEKEKDKEKERAKSPRKRSKTPRRRKARVVPRYMVQIPKIALDMPEADVLEVKKRYTNLYVPSDFFVTSFKWVEVFPPHRSLSVRPCSFHVMHKDVDPVVENDAVLDPPDADYLFSAKVMLLSMPEIDEIYRRSCGMAEDKEKEGSYDDRDFVHPTRLINFLVGLRGKNETMAIGGPWSPSLDGANPASDPTVLIKTATRTCKALTGVDLGNCSRWYRFVEIYYHRAESVHKGKTVPARVETVVLYLPDVWNCQPTRLEWDGLHLNYKKQLDRLLNHDEEAEADEKDTSVNEVQKKEPSHYSQLDPKVMKVNELREELEARNLSSKGLKSQLTARLAKALKTEQEKEEEEKAAKEGKANAKTEKEEKEEAEKKKKEEEEKKKMDEKDKQLLEKRYTLPEKSHILVHPSRVAKSGKFDCTVMSLSLLLDYRPEDSKEHSFEVSLFAELFNEMLMRDFGFRIYKALVEAPEKPKEEKDEKDKKDKKSDKDKKDDDKKDDKKDDKTSVDDDEGSQDEDDKKDKKDSDKKKKEKVKLVTVDPYLLLSFVYFDQTHCGYIFDKDIEELLFTLGLNLSRAQVKKLVQKVISRDSLHYRKLTDKPKDEVANKPGKPVKKLVQKVITRDSLHYRKLTDKPKDEVANKPSEPVTQSVEELASLAFGNKKLLPVFDDDSNSNKRIRKGGSEKKDDGKSLPSGYVMFNGSLLDVNKLQSQLQRSEESRLKIEKMVEKLRVDNSHLKDSNNKNTSTIKKLATELKDFKERLTNTNSELCNMDGKTKLYYSVMAEIYEKLTPIVGQKPNSKEEVIEDVEMEDVDVSSGNQNTTETKKEASEPTSKSENASTAGPEKIDYESKTNENVKLEKETGSNQADEVKMEPKEKPTNESGLNKPVVEEKKTGSNKPVVEEKKTGSNKPVVEEKKTTPESQKKPEIKNEDQTAQESKQEPEPKENNQESKPPADNQESKQHTFAENKQEGKQESQESPSVQPKQVDSPSTRATRQNTPKK